MTRPTDAVKQWHDRLGAMIDQVGQPDYSLREMVEGLRAIRDEMFAASASAAPSSSESEEKGLHKIANENREDELNRFAGVSSTDKEQRMIDIVFDGPPGHESGRFVEVESPPGTSIKFGEWVQREDGYWVLRFAVSATRRSDWEQGVQDAWEYLRSCTFNARDMEAVSAALALILSLKTNTLWGPQVPTDSRKAQEERMDLHSEIAKVLNRASAENESNTPDWILAEYLITCLGAFTVATLRREDWYGCRHYPGKDAGVPLESTARGKER